jgi:hypothetical protein
VFGVGDGAIDVDLCVEQEHSWRAGVAGIVESVAAGGHSDAMGILFLRADGADEVGVCDLVVCGDVGLFDEKNGPGTNESFVS